MKIFLLRQLLVFSTVLVISIAAGIRATAQEPLCACILAWQAGTPTSAACPQKDSAGRYDRSAKSYILFTGADVAAQSKLQEVLSAIRSCAVVRKDYQLKTDYDQVQMTNTYSFLPVEAPVTAGKAAPQLAKMELSLKAGAYLSAVLLKITGSAAIPGGEAAFSAATQNLLKEWSAAIKEKSAFSAPKKGWAAIYPAARFTGTDGAVGNYETGIVYRYEWHAPQGSAEGLQQSIIQALGKVPEVMANGSNYSSIIPGKSNVTGYRLLPPNPPLRIETSVDNTEQAGVVRLSIIVPDGKKKG